MANNFLTVEEARHITADARALQGEYKKAQTKARIIVKAENE